MSSPDTNQFLEVRQGLIPGFGFTSRSELQDARDKARKEPAIDIFRREAFAIQSSPDYSFTADGRTFGLFVDGESIGHRIAACEIMGMDNLAERRHELKEIAGFILESDQSPLIFKDYNELVKAWKDLHRLFNACFSDQECEELGIEPGDDEETERPRNAEFR